MRSSGISWGWSDGWGRMVKFETHQSCIRIYPTPSKFSRGCCVPSSHVSICPRAILTTSFDIPPPGSTCWFLGTTLCSSHLLSGPMSFTSDVLVSSFSPLCLTIYSEVQICLHPHQSRCILQPAGLSVLETL